METNVDQSSTAEGQFLLDLGGPDSVARSRRRRNASRRILPAQRAFFAVMPEPDEVGGLTPRVTGVCDNAGVHGGRLAPERWHMSLFGIDEGDEIADDVFAFGDTLAAKVSMPAFDLMFDRATSFGPPQVEAKMPFVLRGDEGVEGARILHDQLLDSLLQGGPRMSFEPHMTLAYSWSHVPEHVVPPVRWRAKSFVLIQSFVGETRYVIRGRWPLNG